MDQPSVAILTPSRGLIFTEVVEYVEAVRRTYPNVKHYMSHNMPIPQCFNYVTEEALKDPQIEYFWFIEEDVIPPAQALDHLLEAMSMYDIAVIDYGFNGGHNVVVRSTENGQILFTGFGCTLMKRKVLESFQKPIFKADRAFNISNLSWYDVDPAKVYGMYDILFGSEVRGKGHTFYQVPGECRHLQLDSLGQKEVNNGCHQISEKGRIVTPLTLPLSTL